MYTKVLSRSCVDQMFTNKYVGRLTPVARESNPNLTRGTRKLSMLAIHDSYSNATLADTTSMETNLTTAKATRRRTKMLLMRMPMLESDSKVCVYAHGFQSNIANMLSQIRAFVSSEAPLRITSAPDYVTSLLIHCPARHGQNYTGQTATGESESMESEAFE
jgi:hypothetical protein